MHSQTRTSPAAPGGPRRLAFAPLSPGTTRHLALSAAVALGLTVTLGLAACGAPGPSPMTTFPPTTHSASPTAAPEPEPTSTVPTSRAEASWEVVEEFFDAYTYGMQTGDSSRLVPLATEDCATCANLIAAIDELAARRVKATGGEFLYPFSQGLESPDPRRKVWYIQYQQAPIDSTLEEPAETTHQDAIDGTMYVELTEHPDGWLVSLISATMDVVDR